MSKSFAASTDTDSRVSPWTIFLVYLRLGCTSFGGPIAHLGYFHDEFVVRRNWVEEATFTDIVGLCQFLPGPASSQVGFKIELQGAQSRSVIRGCCLANRTEPTGSWFRRECYRYSCAS